MEHEPIVAIGLLTQANLQMLGNSLKVVFRVDEDTAQFDALLRALDQVDKVRPLRPG